MGVAVEIRLRYDCEKTNVVNISSVNKICKIESWKDGILRSGDDGQVDCAIHLDLPKCLGNRAGDL